VFFVLIKHVVPYIVMNLVTFSITSPTTLLTDVLSP